MGGGKTETTRDFSTSRMYADGTDLFIKDVIRYVSTSKSLAAFPIGSHLVRSISAFYNSKMFEKIGILGTAPGRLRVLDELAIKNHYNATRVSHVSYKDSTGNSLPSHNIAIIDYLNTLTFQSVSETVNFNIVHSPLSIHNLPYGDKGNASGTLVVTKEIKKHQVTDQYGTFDASIQMTVDSLGYPIPMYTLAGDGTYNVISHYTSNSVVRDHIINVPAQTKVLLFTSYDAINTIDWKYNVVDSETEYNFLVMQFKQDGAFIESKKLRAVMNNFGIRQKELYEEDGLAASTLKHAMICHSGPLALNATKFSAVAADHALAHSYSTNTGELAINTPTMSILYKTEEYSDSEGSSGVNNSISFNGNQFSADMAGSAFLIPINAVDDMPLKLKYEFIEAYLSLGFLSEVVTKKKWYQTGLFSFIVIIISIIIAAYTGYYVGYEAAGGLAAGEAAVSAGYAAAGTAVAKAFVVMMVVKVAFSISPELGALVSIAAIAYGAYESGGWNAMDSFDKAVTIVKVAGSLSSYYFNLANDKLLDKIMDVNKQTDELETAISDLKKDSIYSPIDATQGFYDLAFDIHYMYMDQMFAYDNLYDFDTAA